MSQGLIYLVTDTEGVAEDVRVALGVIEIPLKIFEWNEIEVVAEQAAIDKPGIVLVHIAAVPGEKHPGNQCLVGAVTMTGLLTEWLPVVALRDASVSWEAQEYAETFTGIIPLPLQFPAFSQLMRDLITERMISE